MPDDIEMPPERGETPDSSTMIPTPGLRAIALCRHAPPGEAPHVDLFLAPENPAFGEDDRVLGSWRVPCDPRTLAPGTWVDIIPTPPHRGCYLQLRAPRQLDGNRGLLSPLAHGEAAVHWITPRIRSLEIGWSDGSRTLLELECARETGGNRSRLRRLEEPGTQDSAC